MARALQEFEQESAQQFSDIETALLRLEQNPFDAQQINTVFRAIHTIKGSAGLVDLDTIKNFCHLTEALLDRLRGGDRQLDQSLGSLLLRCNEHVRRLVQRGCSGQPPTPADLSHDGTLSDELTAVLNGPTAVPSTSAGSAEAGKRTEKSASVDTPDLASFTHMRWMLHGSNGAVALILDVPGLLELAGRP